MEKIKLWDAEAYQKNFGFVSGYGDDLLKLLEPKPGMTILDIGCGNGILTHRISQKGADVTGIDSSEEMLRLAESNYPALKFYRINALELPYAEEFDAVFSNAVFHWIDKQDKLIYGISSALKKGGHLVCEFGGAGCAETVHAALRTAFERRGLAYAFPFYFPTIGEYAPLLESQGLRVEYAALFSRPTELKEGDSVTDWINMFVTEAFEEISAEIKQEILTETEEALRQVLYHKGRWIIDYVRIRIKAVKL